jgi:hypothetical protein
MSARRPVYRVSGLPQSETTKTGTGAHDEGMTTGCSGSTTASDGAQVDRPALIPAILARTWRGRAVSTRNPDPATDVARHGRRQLPRWPTGGIGRAAGLTPFGAAETI